MYRSLSNDEWVDGLRSLIRSLGKESESDPRNQLFLMSSIIFAENKTEQTFKDVIPEFCVPSRSVPIALLDSISTNPQRNFNEGGGKPYTAISDIEEKMTDMAYELKETANRVRQTLVLDQRILGITRGLQEESHGRTKGHNDAARDLRRSSKFGAFTSLFMILLSLAIFLLLIPLIWIT